MVLKLTLSFLFLVNIFTSFNSSAFENKKIEVYLILSVDWEGDTLRPSNLNAIQEFNKEFPEYPVIHFLNPAYYTKNKFLSAEQINKNIRSVLKSNDEIGLHVHSWENLVRAAKVDYRSGPTFWNTLDSLGRGHEKGDDVPLDLYYQDEIYQILKYSIELLNKNGFHDLVAFRGGGWISGSKIQKVLNLLNIRIDSSAVAPEFVEKKYPNTFLAKLVRYQWDHISLYSTPYRESGDFLLQFPNNLSLADYVTAKEFFKSYLKIIKDARRNNKDKVYIHFGWHQESAVEYFEHTGNNSYQLVTSHFLNRVTKGLNLINAHAKQHNIIIKPTGFSGFPKSLIKGTVPFMYQCLNLLAPNGRKDF